MNCKIMFLFKTHPENIYKIVTGRFLDAFNIDC